MESTLMFEPGVLMTFRRFTGVRLTLFLFVLLIYWLSAGWRGLGNWVFLAMLLDAGLLLVYLSLPRLQTLLKDSYLPVGVIWATLGPMLQLHVFFFMFINSVPVRSAFLLILQPTLVLFIPLVIIAWQYSPRSVLIFCVLTFLMDGLFSFFTYSIFKNTVPSSVIFAPLMGMSFTRAVIFFFVGNMIVNIMQVQREQHQRLSAANERLAQYAATVEQLAISRERNRVARELHDVLAHTMSGVAVELEGVRAMLRVDIDQAEALLGQSLRAVREGLSEARRALQALRASPLEDLGLALALQNLAESIAGPAGLETDIQIEKDMPDYPIEVQQSVYRVAQEALTNVVTHAQASRVQLCLKRVGATLRLSIRDNGVGFDEKSLDLNQKYGLLGIRERVEMLHGQVSIMSQVGSGTEVTVLYETNPVEVPVG